MANSKLATWKWQGATDHFNRRDHKIDTITIHHMAGDLSLSTCCNSVQSRAGSCNYCIDSNGMIGVMIDEEYRAWTSGSRSNDMRAVTIEVANCSGDPDWKISDKAMTSLIALCEDICRRNGIEKLRYTGDTSGNMTMHKWFAATGCPGPYLSGKFGYIADEVNKRLGTAEAPAPEAPAEEVYRVRKTWSDAKSQIGAFKNLENAKRVCVSGYKVFNSSGKAVYEPSNPVLYKVRVTHPDLNIRSGPGVDNKIVGEITDKGVYSIVAEEIVSGQTWGKLKSGAGWICLSGFTVSI